MVTSMIAACGDNDDEGSDSLYENPVRSIQISTTEHTFDDPNSSLTLTVVVLPREADNPAYTWTVDDPNVASIDETNTIRPLSNGVATFTATTEDGGFTASCVVTVELPEIAPPDLVFAAEGILLDLAEYTFTSLGDTLLLNADVLPFNATNKNLTWASSDESVATVDELGNVTSVKNGTTTITVTTEDGGFTASCAVTVNKATTSNPGTSSPSPSTVKLPSIPSPKRDSDRYLISDNLPEFNAINPDVVAWLYIPGTNMNFPVAQSSNSENEYYLTVYADKKYRYEGMAMLDWRSSVRTSGEIMDSNTIIYGHAKGTLVFDQLENVTQEDSWFQNKENLYINLNTMKVETVWQVFACYYTDCELEGNYYLQTNFYKSKEQVNKELKELEAADFDKYAKTVTDPDLLQAFMTDDDAFLKFATSWKNRVDTVGKYKGLADYMKGRDYGVKLEAGDKIITLSTCADASGPMRYVLLAKLIKIRPRTGR